MFVCVYEGEIKLGLNTITSPKISHNPKSHLSVPNTRQYIQSRNLISPFARCSTSPWESLNMEYLEIQDERE